MGSGDDIPEILTQLGLNLKLISDDELASADLSSYGTIVLGIRAYDTRKAVRRWNRRLLDYVSAGGTLLVQYNSGIAEFNAGNFTPYLAELGRERITDEDAPMVPIAPDAPILRFPNRIVASISRAGCRSAVCISWLAGTRTIRRRCRRTIRARNRSPAVCLRRATVGPLPLYRFSFFRQLPAGFPGRCACS